MKKRKAGIEGVKLARLAMTCNFCPSQWDAFEMGTKRYLYIRFRHGHLTVDEYKDYPHCNQPVELFSWEDEDDPDNGIMSTEEMLRITGMVFTGTKEGVPEFTGFKV
mgnify:CR=1 FL=1